MKKCYDCRTAIKGKKIFCKDCQKKRDEDTKPVRGSSTLIIYDNI